MKTGILAVLLACVFAAVRMTAPAQATPKFQPRTVEIRESKQPVTFSVTPRDEMRVPKWGAYNPDPSLPMNQRGKIIWTSNDFGPLDPSRIAH